MCLRRIALAKSLIGINVHLISSHLIAHPLPCILSDRILPSLAPGRWVRSPSQSRLANRRQPVVHRQSALLARYRARLLEFVCCPDWRWQTRLHRLFTSSPQPLASRRPRYLAPGPPSRDLLLPESTRGLGDQNQRVHFRVTGPTCTRSPISSCRRCRASSTRAWTNPDQVCGRRSFACQGMRCACVTLTPRLLQPSGSAARVGPNRAKTDASRLVVTLKKRKPPRRSPIRSRAVLSLSQSLSPTHQASLQALTSRRCFSARLPTFGAQAHIRGIGATVTVHYPCLSTPLSRLSTRAVHAHEGRSGQLAGRGVSSQQHQDTACAPSTAVCG